MFMRYSKLYLGVFILLGVALTAGVGFTGGVCRWSALPTAKELLAAGATGAGEQYCSMQRGRALAVTECTRCHRFFFPCEYPAPMWPSLIQDMGRSAVLTKRQIGDMTRYMVAASRLTRRGSGAGSLQGVLTEPADPATVKHGKVLAESKCVDCHRYYRPGEYSPTVWPSIVESMGEMTSLSHDEMWAIAMYFVAASRGKVDSGD